MKVLILAAGRSNRFFENDSQGQGTERTKLLAHFFGVPLIQHVVDRALELHTQGTASHIVIAISDDTIGDALEGAIRSADQNRSVLDTGVLTLSRVAPHEPGSALTVSGALRSLAGTRGPVMMLAGDVPLVSLEDLVGLFNAFNSRPKKCAGTILGVRRPDPDQYGRLECLGSSDKRRVKRIVDFRHLKRMSASARERARANPLVNAGAMIIDMAYLRSALRSLLADGRRAGLTAPTIGDIVKSLHSDKRSLTILESWDYLGTSGIDTPQDLTRLEAMVSNAQSSSIRKDAVDASTRQRIQRNLEKTLLTGLHLSTSQVVSQPGVEGFVLSKPRGAEIGGDFFAAEVLGKGRCSYLLGDGQGHGINGAMNMLPVLSGFRMCFRTTLSTKHVLHQLNDLCNTVTIQASALYTILEKADVSGRRRVFASLAGHPPSIIFRPDGTDIDFPNCVFRPIVNARFGAS